MKKKREINKRKINKRKAMLFLLLAIAIGIFGVRTYSKYVTSISKTSSVQVATWNFNTDNQSNNLTFSLEDTYDANTIVENKIAPGTAGTFTINVSNTTSEVGVKYLIKFPKASSNASGALPEPIELYVDDTEYSGYELVPHYTDVNETIVDPDYDDNYFTIRGTLPAPTGSNAAQLTKQVVIDWNWPYETYSGGYDTTAGDAIDTEIGSSNSLTKTITATITGYQVQPVVATP